MREWKESYWNDDDDDDDDDERKKERKDNPLPSFASLDSMKYILHDYDV